MGGHVAEAMEHAAVAGGKGVVGKLSAESRLRSP